MFDIVKVRNFTNPIDRQRAVEDEIDKCVKEGTLRARDLIDIHVSFGFYDDMIHAKEYFLENYKSSGYVFLFELVNTTDCKRFECSLLPEFFLQDKGDKEPIIKKGEHIKVWDNIEKNRALKMFERSKNPKDHYKKFGVYNVKKNIIKTTDLEDAIDLAMYYTDVYYDAQVPLLKETTLAAVKGDAK